MKHHKLTILLATICRITSTSVEKCCRQAREALCRDNLCCGQHGRCGNLPQHCGTNCHSQCAPSTPTTPSATPTPTPSGCGVDTVISLALFDELLKHRNSPNCPGNRFYSYQAFIAAARSFNGFGMTGDADVRKKEVAAFRAQTSHETTGGWPSAPDGPYAWGYCFARERGNPGTFCTSKDWECPAGRQYLGRGPIQLTQ